VSIATHRRPFSPGITLVHLILTLIGLACLIPMILVVSISLSDEKIVAREGYSLWPVGFTTFAYGYILQKPGQMLQAYGVTLLVTVTGTVLGLLFCSMLGYAISRKDYKYHRFLGFYVFFTLLFSGGMVPFYILVTRYLGLKNNMLALILPYLVTAWYGVSSSRSCYPSPNRCWRPLASSSSCATGMTGSWLCSLLKSKRFSPCNICFTPS
jgi:putative aldouronate transport system permease protein